MLKAALLAGLVLLLFLSACNLRPTPTPTPMPASAGVHTPEDLRALFDRLPEGRKLIVDDEVAVRFAPGLYEPTTAEWVGAAFMYHVPSMSSLTFGWDGRVTRRNFKTDEARERLESVLGNELVMEQVRQRLVAGTYPQDEAILQLSQTGGLLAGWDEHITLWGNGRVTVLRRGGHYGEFHLDRDTLARIVSRAMLLYDLDSRYNIRPEFSGLGYTFFTARTNRGRKTVSVYGMSLTESRHVGSGGRDQVALDALRSIYQLVQEAMPPDLPATVPDKVVVTAMPFPCRDSPPAGEWPPSLLGRLEGDRARRAIEAGGLGSGRCFTLNGRPHLVEVQPLLPLLDMPSPLWPEDGLPAPVWATAYNADSQVFEAPDSSDFDLTQFYRNRMPERGWRLAKEGNSLQVWTRQKYDHDPIVLIQFHDGRFSLQQVPVYDGVPVPPTGVLGACQGTWCQLVRGATPEKAEAWFREYMGFLRWRESALNTYVWGDRRVRLEFRQAEEGVEVPQERGVVLPATWPPPPTPTPGR